MHPSQYVKRLCVPCISSSCLCTLVYSCFFRIPTLCPVTFGLTWSSFSRVTAFQDWPSWTRRYRGLPIRFFRCTVSIGYIVTHAPRPTGHISARPCFFIPLSGPDSPSSSTPISSRYSTNAHNKGDKPGPVIVDKIEVVELEMGTRVHLWIVCLAHAIYDLAATPTRDSGHWQTHRRPVSRIFRLHTAVMLIALKPRFRWVRTTFHHQSVVWRLC